MKISLQYFENEGYVDYGFYIYVDGIPETIESDDPRYPQKLVFGTESSALEYVLEKYFNSEIEYKELNHE